MKAFQIQIVEPEQEDTVCTEQNNLLCFLTSKLRT